jgi:hypothetical protein
MGISNLLLRTVGLRTTRINPVGGFSIADVAWHVCLIGRLF